MRRQSRHWPDCGKVIGRLTSFFLLDRRTKFKLSQVKDFYQLSRFPAPLNTSTHVRCLHSRLLIPSMTRAAVKDLVKSFYHYRQSETCCHRCQSGFSRREDVYGLLFMLQRKMRRVKFNKRLFTFPRCTRWARGLGEHKSAAGICCAIRINGNDGIPRGRGSLTEPERGHCIWRHRNLAIHATAPPINPPRLNFTSPSQRDVSECRRLRRLAR